MAKETGGGVAADIFDLVWSGVIWTQAQVRIKMRARVREKPIAAAIQMIKIRWPEKLGFSGACHDEKDK
jgi:hypothetical protein